MKIITTIIDKTSDNTTCEGKSVNIDVEPKSVVQTSPETFDDEENIFIKR